VDDLKRPARLVDVAKRAGVSNTTASVVLNGKDERIPEATRGRVLAAAEELGYRPNSMARSLRLQRSMTVALVSDEIATQPFAGALIKGAQEAAWAMTYLLLVIDTAGNRERERYVIQELQDRHIDGILYGATYHQVVEPPAVLREIPTVMVDARDADAAFTSVVPDEVGGAYEAVSHLIALGHERIGYLQNFKGIPATSLRLEGYHRALKDGGLEFDESLVAETVPENRNVAAESARSLLDRADRPTALFCFSDRAAAGAYVAARQLGLRVPDDLSLVGFDNLELVAAWLDPGLTTMQLPHEAMGRWAVERLVASIEDPGAPPRQHLMPCPLVERGSVAPPTHLQAEQAGTPTDRNS
jgi:LacI family transcriptional regulator